MLFSIVAGLMVVLVTAFWAYQGFFSSALMLFESLVAAMLAFAFFEQLNELWSESIGDGIGLPLAFMSIFAPTLVALRIFTDKYIPETVRLPMAVDRAGGALCGFFTGMILVGSALVAIQMMPIGSSVLGFERITTYEKGPNRGLPREPNTLGLFGPDSFVISSVNMLSNKRFGGSNPFAHAKPDYLLDLYAARAAPQAEARFVVPEDCLRVEAYWDAKQIDRVTHSLDGDEYRREYATHEPTSPLRKLLVSRVRLYPSAAHEDKPGEIRFRVHQFRLVGPRPGGTASPANPSLYLACGMSDIYINRQYEWNELRRDQHTRLVRFGPETNLILAPASTKAAAKLSGSGEEATVEYYEFDVAFEVPDDPDFEPWYIEFKRGARVECNKSMKTDAPPRAMTALASGGGSVATDSLTSSGDQVGRPGRGRVHVANAVEERTGVFTTLPTPLDKRDPAVSRYLRGGRFNEGHVYVAVNEEELDPANAVTEFFIPSDKRLVQIGAEQVMAEGVYGRALNYAAQIAAQIKVHTDDGSVYFAQGVYSLAPVGGELIFEVQYWPDAQMPERCLKKPIKLTRNIMRNARTDERRFGYIFLVDPGVRLVGFSAGRRNQGQQRLNIQVPE